MKSLFAPRRADTRESEYFGVDFNIACDILKSSTNAEINRRKEVAEAVIEIFAKDKTTKKFDDDFYRFVDAIIQLPLEDLVLIESVGDGLLKRQMLLSRKELQEA